MLKQKKILIVEDNELNRELLREILWGEYTVLEAENGREALNVLEERADDIALILLDVMMPVMDGYAFLEAIRETPRFTQIPVIVMTQEDSEADEITALSHGATDFVPKPYRPRVILHRVASIIKLRETAAMVNQLKYDQLTGMYSREFFYQMVIKRLAEHPEKEYSIVCSNIENFKLYNDAFGVKAGDRLLCSIAGIARSALGETCICGRFAADRFLFLQERSMEAADRLSASSLNASHHSAACNAIIKWGVYEIVDRSVPVEQMCDRAFLAVDSIKGKYHKWVAVYDDEVRSRLLRTQAITDAMESALSQGQFSVYLQPKYSLNDDCLCGAEALVRWTHPELGFLSPGEFIPIFERNGFITRLDRYVWEEVCRLIQTWSGKGMLSLPVSVNVSRADLYQPNLVETLTELVRRYDVPPAFLHLEITESAYTDNPTQIIDTVRELRNRGFVIEMDDFGSGYSSLNMLNQMKIDILKLDMKFIQSETAKPTDRGILHFIVDLAKWMSLGVVAEGVETREQLNRLREIGCDYVQGYFFSKPIPAEAFERTFLNQPLQMHIEKPGAGASVPTLIIADEDESRRAQTAALFSENYRVLDSGTADQAMDDVQGHARQVSAVIASMTLPGDGAAQLTACMRRNETAWRIPVLATGPAEVVLEEAAIAMGADDYAAYPCTPALLQRRLSRVLGMDAHHRREHELQKEANLDYLTGLLNRRGMHVAINALRQEDLPLTTYLFDLDGLKGINDRIGHMAGDSMIRTFADILRRCTREGDILVRYGGDEFVVLLRHLGDIGIAKKKAAEICRAFNECILADGSRAACSVGIALCGVDERPSEELIRRADEALYAAKRSNKGGLCVFPDKPETSD